MPPDVERGLTLSSITVRNCLCKCAWAVGTYRSLDVPPEPVVEHVGEVESLLLRLDRLLAHEPQAAGDDLERRRRGEDLPLHAVGKRRHLRMETFL